MTKQQFLIIKNKLISSVAHFGVKVSFAKAKFKYGVYGVSGSYSSLKKKINIRTHGNCSYLEILATLAHEVRHAQHDFLHLFPLYYNPNLETKLYRQQVKQGLITPPSNEIGLEAENDCNLYAVNFLKQEGFPLNCQVKWCQSFFEPYPIYNLLTEHLNRLVPR